MDLTDLAEMVKERSVKELKETGSVMPCFFSINNKGSMSIYAVPFSNDVEKQLGFRFVKKAFEADKVEAFCFVSEAWTVQRGKDALDGRMPSECEDRIEVVSIIAVSHHGNFMIQEEIIRDTAGNPTGTRNRLKKKGEGILLGRIPDMLPPKETVETIN